MTDVVCCVCKPRTVVSVGSGGAADEGALILDRPQTRERLLREICVTDGRVCVYEEVTNGTLYS